MPLVTLRCHRCAVAFTREQSRTAAARGRTHDYCSRECARAAMAVQGLIARQNRAAKEPTAKFVRGSHQRFVFLPSHAERVAAGVAIEIPEGRDVEQARPAPEKCANVERAMPSVRVF